MSTNNVLFEKDANAQAQQDNKGSEQQFGDIKSMEYHRQVLESRKQDGSYVLFVLALSSLPQSG